MKMGASGKDSDVLLFLSSFFPIILFSFLKLNSPCYFYFYFDMLSSQDFIFPCYHSVISTFKNFQTDPMCSHNLVNFVSGHVKSPDHIYRKPGSY